MGGLRGQELLREDELEHRTFRRPSGGGGWPGTCSLPMQRVAMRFVPSALKLVYSGVPG